MPRPKPPPKPPKPGAKKLSPLALQSAMLSAMGKTPTEISRLLGCAMGTVVRYGEDERWVAERDKWLEHQLLPLAQAIEAQRARMLALHDAFVDKVYKALDAKDPHGEPNWPVVLAGMKLVNDSPVIKQLLGAQTQQAQESGPNQVTVVQFNLPRDRLPRRMLDVIDAEPVTDKDTIKEIREVSSG